MYQMLAKAESKVCNQELYDEEEDKRLTEEGRKFLSLMDDNWQEYHSTNESDRELNSTDNASAVIFRK